MFSPKYNKLKVDKLPIIHVPEHIHCPCCNAPHNYIYDSTGGRGQLWCIVCNTHFNRQNYLDNPIELHCPHCSGALSVVKNRKLFNIHKCMNKNCSYYQNSLNSLSKEDLEVYKSNPEKFKLHYIYREFKIDFFKVDLYSLPQNASSLQFCRFSPHVMGLCLTYLVN